MNSEVAFWKHEPVADQTAASLAAQTLLFYQQTQTDLLKLTPAGNYQIAGRGGEAEWLNDPLGRRTFTRRFIQSPDDWYKLNADTTAFELEIVLAAKLTRAALPVSVPLYVTLFSPATLALMLAGPEVLSKHLQSAPQAVEYGVGVLLQSVIKLLYQYHQAGAAGYFIANQHADHSILNEEDYQRFAQLSDQNLLDNAMSYGDTLLHLHGQQIIAAAIPKAGKVRIHYELVASNPSPVQFREISQCEAVIGLPITNWQQPEQYQRVANNLLTQFRQKSAIFTFPCVVPLAIANSQLQSWAKQMRSAFATC